MTRIRFGFLLFAILLSTAALADGPLYGLRNPGDGGRQLVTVDPPTAAVTVIGPSIDPPNGTSSGVVALDSAGGRFFFVGMPAAETVWRLYTLDTATGAELSSPQIDPTTAILGLEFDDAEGVLYGMQTPADAGKRICSYDPSTGAATCPGPSIDPPLGVPGGTTALDAAGNRFFFMGTRNTETTQRLYTVDTATGLVLFSPQIDPTTAILGLEYDAGEGVLYALRTPADSGKQLVTIDPATGVATPVSVSIDPPLGIAGGVNALDADGNRFFFPGVPTGESDFRLYTIDTATGAFSSATIVGSASQFFVGLAWPSEPPPPPVVTVTIDIRPASIHPRGKGVIPVAILTTPTFDATTVDVSTVRFGPGSAVEAHGIGHPQDVDGDGDIDLMLHFSAGASGIACGDTSATLTGETTGGQAFEGEDTFTTVGCP